MFSLNFILCECSTCLYSNYEVDVINEEMEEISPQLDHMTRILKIEDRNGVLTPTSSGGFKILFFFFFVGGDIKMD